ncbi:MAG TPA: CPBP family glutamic-type intramembrane protease [Acidimicrobiales bacterium]|nr:CPBP family glutamic-type intramembrane protease [Acidimicrobiales bacterium]
MAQQPYAPAGSWYQPADLPPANWYPDPSGAAELRYWDGRSWTSTVSVGGQVHERPMPPPPPHPYVPPAPPSEPRPEPQPRLPGRAAVTALIGFVAGLAASIVLSLLGAVLGLPEIVRLVVSQAGLWSGLLGACVVVSRRFGTGHVARDFGLVVAWSDLGWGLLMAIAGRMAVAIAVLPFLPFPRLVGGDEEAFRFFNTDTASFIVVAVLALVGAPIVEELFFRGVLQGAFLDRLGTVWAIGLSSVLFGLAHFNPILGLANVSLIAAITAAGIVFGITVRLRRLGSSVFAHSFFNMVAVGVAAAAR